ncbi:hypothetical protein B0T14DRAFT_415131 [Immersiella caudata]|uniref:Nuclear pore assembly and biogenesis-domain-containing protein n=1 Tax=Immersiella caudata TaxID=314043 RepID=A0AA39XGE8_9PEZI|nr:hypothetical protein B0T14DRAFT_415131 [Immersiella caudata]
MDFPAEWTMSALKSLLPDPILTFFNAYILSPASPIQALLRQLQPLLSHMLTLLAPLFDRLTAALASSPDAVVLIFFLAVVVFVVQLLAYLQRIMLFWTRLAFRMLFWAGVFALGAMVWQRGLEQSARDAAVVGRGLVSFGTMCREVFLKEYRRYDDLEKARRAGAAGGGYGARGRGGGYGY